MLAVAPIFGRGLPKLTVLHGIEKWTKKTFNYTFNVDDKQSSSVEIVYVKEGKVFIRTGLAKTDCSS
jgi:hypothetical protein